MGSWFDEVIGAVLVGLPVIGPSIVVPEALDALAHAGGGGSGSAAAQSRAVQLKAPVVVSSPVSVPNAASGTQGVAAKAAADEATLLKDYNDVLAQLDQNRVSVSSVNAEAQAAYNAVQDLQQEISSETAQLSSATSPAQIASLNASIHSQLAQMQTILQQQNNLAQAEAQTANELAQQYASVATGSTGSVTSGGATGSGVADSTTGTADPYTTPTTPNPYSATELAAMQNPYAGTYSAVSPYSSYSATAPSSSVGSDASSELSSMLPEMMMPAMMIPAMTSGMGANSAGAREASSPQGVQLTGDDTPSDGEAKPKSATVAHASDDSDGAGQKPPGGDTGTQPASVQPVGNSGAAPVASTEVKLPDGTSVHTPNAQAATAVRAALNGASTADAYQQAGVTLPPPGTPVLNPVAPGDLQAGDVGVWKDHQVLALGNDKVLVSGQVQPESSVGSSPDFLGWMRPTVSSSAQPPTVVPPPASAAMSSPTAAGVPTPVAAAPAPAPAISTPQ